MSDPRTVIGPLARTVEDLALVLGVIAGEDWQDASVVPMPANDMHSVMLPGLRAAYYTHHAGAEPTPETVATVQSAARALAAAGISVEEALPERIVEAHAITLDYWRRPESELLDEWRRSRATIPSDSAQCRPTTSNARSSSGSLPARADPLHGALRPDHHAGRRGSRSLARRAGGCIPYTLPYSLTGYPCVVVRAGTSPDGMPIGVQLVARPGARMWHWPPPGTLRSRWADGSRQCCKEVSRTSTLTQ